MNRKWVLNASPLIVLAKISRLPLFGQLCSEVVIPAGVAGEVDRGPVEDLARTWLQGAGAQFIRRLDEIVPMIQEWDLGKGETEVLSWAYLQPGYEAIVDDKAARNCAVALGIPVRGTIGVVLLAKREGLVPALEPLLGQLEQAGLRIDDVLRRKALELAGEQ